jgi:hypothetical protein
MQVIITGHPWQWKDHTQHLWVLTGLQCSTGVGCTIPFNHSLHVWGMGNC